MSAPLRRGVVVEVHGILATVLLEGSATGERLRCRPPRDRLTPVVGDRVTVDEDGAQIAAIAPRARTVVRHVGEHRALTIATHVDRLLIVSAVDPPPRPGLVDRVLCALAPEVDAAPGTPLAIEVLLVVNKVDLPGADEAIARLRDHEALGYPVVPVSADRGDGVDALRARLDRGLTVVMGHSGVGKSTLLNRLVPGARLLTHEVNPKTGKGRHTTTVSTCHGVGPPWPDGGLIVDTPGIRTFHLYGLALDELGRRFPGLGAFAGGCRFVDCLHEGEPDCAVEAAAASGDLDGGRLEAWRTLLAQVRVERDAPPPRRGPSKHRGQR